MAKKIKEKGGENSKQNLEKQYEEALKTVQSLSTENITLQTIIEELQSHINDIDKDRELLHGIVEKLKKLNKEIQESFSYKLGFSLSFPFRFFNDSFINFSFALFSLKAFLVQIFNKKFILSDDETSYLKTADIKNETYLTMLTKFRKSKLRVHIDKALVVNKSYLILEGWMFNKLQSIEIKQIVLSKNNNSKYKVFYGKIRPDVKAAYPEFDCLNSHFSVQLESRIEENDIFKLSIIDNRNTKVHIDISFEFINDISYLPKDEQYKFICKHRSEEMDIKGIKNEISNFSFNPKISIIIPVYNVAAHWLEECIDSVMQQIYPNWEICIYDDNSSNPETIKFLKSLKDKKKIKLEFGSENLNISEASNKAIKLAGGDYIGLLDHDDLLSPDALYRVVKALSEKTNLKFIYSDEDKVDENGVFSEPNYKSDFNRILLESQNYISHFSVIEKHVGDKLGWFRKGFEGSQDHDLFLRVTDHLSNDEIYHIPEVLYHWRTIEGSTAADIESKTYIADASKKALNDHLQRINQSGKVISGPKPGTYFCEKEITSFDKVCIIVPFKDEIDYLKKLLPSIINKTNYPNYEIILVSNNSKEKQTFTYIEDALKNHSQIKFLEYNIPFNYSQINNWAVKQCDSEYILFLNNDMEVISDSWLSYMVAQLQDTKVGAVGAKLLYEDETIQHAGVIIGIGGVAGHSHKYLPDEENGYFSRPHLPQNVSACTAACLLVKRKLFEQLEGFDKVNLPIAFNDIDLCLKIISSGYEIIYEPRSKLFHFESKSRGAEDTPNKISRFNEEIKFMKSKWGTTLTNDKFYNKNLTLIKEDFSYNLKFN